MKTENEVGKRKRGDRKGQHNKKWCGVVIKITKLSAHEKLNSKLPAYRFES